MSEAEHPLKWAAHVPEWLRAEHRQCERGARVGGVEVRTIGCNFSPLIHCSYCARHFNYIAVESVHVRQRSDVELFPIQGSGPTAESRAPSTVPWWLAREAYDYYVTQYGTEQSLERIAERGGFGRAELLSLLRKERP